MAWRVSNCCRCENIYVSHSSMVIFKMRFPREWKSIFSREDRRMRSRYMFQSLIVIHQVCTNDLLHICVQRSWNLSLRAKIPQNTRSRVIFVTRSQNHSDYSTESTFSLIYVHTQYHRVLMRRFICSSSRFSTLKWFLFVESNTDGTETPEEAYMVIRRGNTDHLEDTASCWSILCLIVVIYVDQNVVQNLYTLLLYFFMN